MQPSGGRQLAWFFPSQSRDLLDVLGEVDNSVGVSPLVIVPGDQLVEVVVESDAGLRVEDRASGVVVEVRADDLLGGVSENSLESGKVKIRDSGSYGGLEVHAR